MQSATPLTRGSTVELFLPIYEARLVSASALFHATPLESSRVSVREFRGCLRRRDRVAFPGPRLSA